MDLMQADPKGLVRESFVIEGITASECRSIFLDWALSLAADTGPHEAMRALLAHYAPGAGNHPMTAVLTDGLKAPEHPSRRGGRAARIGAQH